MNQPLDTYLQDDLVFKICELMYRPASEIDSDYNYIDAGLEAELSKVENELLDVCWRWLSEQLTTPADISGEYTKRLEALTALKREGLVAGTWDDRDFMDYLNKSMAGAVDDLDITADVGDTVYLIPQRHKIHPADSF